jgi:hypothetical protein
MAVSALGRPVSTGRSNRAATPLRTGWCPRQRTALSRNHSPVGRASGLNAVSPRPRFPGRVEQHRIE